MANINQLRTLLGEDLLSQILGSSTELPTSLNPTDDARLVWLSDTVAHLAGTYDEPGIRRWLVRPRAQLEGLTPLQCLRANWQPLDDGVQRVFRLAKALAGPSLAT
jgi:hypothetical protein